MTDIKKLIDWVLSDKEPDFDLVPISFEASILRQLLGDKKLRDIGMFSQVLFAESCKTVLIDQDHDLHMPKEIAMAKLDSALQFDPSAVYVNFLKGFLFNENSEKDKAISEFKKALNGNPNFIAAKIMLTKEFFASRNYDSVLTYVKLGNPNLSSDLLYWISYKNLNNKDQAAVHYARVLNQCYSPLNAELTFWNNLNVADLLIDIKEHTEAIPFYEKSIPALQRFLGDSMFRKIESHSLKESDKTIYLMEEYINLYYNLACCYAITGNCFKALESIEKALDGGWIDFEWMRKDDDLKALHSNKKFFKMISQKEKAFKKLNQK
jgi:tetratricopeptide (TPR) repeat protein